MIKSKNSSPVARARTAGLALGLSFVLVPVCAYIGGSLVVGDYEGASGLLGYLVAIFRDALRGRWLAWLLILAPVLVVGTWLLAFRVIGYFSTPNAERHAEARPRG